MLSEQAKTTGGSDRERAGQEKWLEEYPGPAQVREAGRVYLEDYFDAESIEIDKLVYLALHHRAIPIWHRESEET